MIYQNILLKSKKCYCINNLSIYCNVSRDFIRSKDNQKTSTVSGSCIRKRIIACQFCNPFTLKTLEKYPSTPVLLETVNGRAKIY